MWSYPEDRLPVVGVINAVHLVSGGGAFFAPAPSQVSGQAEDDGREDGDRGAARYRGGFEHEAALGC